MARCSQSTAALARHAQPSAHRVIGAATQSALRRYGYRRGIV
jgi:hypothetical protein